MTKMTNYRVLLLFWHFVPFKEPPKCSGPKGMTCCPNWQDGDAKEQFIGQFNPDECITECQVSITNPLKLRIELPLFPQAVSWADWELSVEMCGSGLIQSKSKLNPFNLDMDWILSCQVLAHQIPELLTCVVTISSGIWLFWSLCHLAAVVLSSFRMWSMRTREFR